MRQVELTNLQGHGKSYTAVVSRFHYVFLPPSTCACSLSKLFSYGAQVLRELSLPQTRSLHSWNPPRTAPLTPQSLSRNVGPAGETYFLSWCRKLKWVAVAVFFPEIMLYTAGKQWFSASRLCKKLNNLASKEQTEMPTNTSSPFWSNSKTPIRAVCI